MFMIWPTGCDHLQYSGSCHLSFPLVYSLSSLHLGAIFFLEMFKWITGAKFKSLDVCGNNITMQDLKENHLTILLQVQIW